MIFVWLFSTFWTFFLLLYIWRMISDIDHKFIGLFALVIAIFTGTFIEANLYLKTTKYIVKNNKVEVIKTQSFWFYKNKSIKYYDINKTYKGE